MASEVRVRRSPLRRQSRRLMECVRKEVSEVMDGWFKQVDVVDE